MVATVGIPLSRKSRERCPGQGQSFLRVGAGAQLIKQDQVARGGAFQDAHDIGHVRRKRAQALLDALLVADIGVDCFKQGELAT